MHNSNIVCAYVSVLCRNNLSCDGKVEFPLEEKCRLVDMLVCRVYSLFSVNKYFVLFQSESYGSQGIK